MGCTFNPEIKSELSLALSIGVIPVLNTEVSLVKVGFVILIRQYLYLFSKHY